MTDDALENILFLREKSATNKRMPDYAYIRKELWRNGVSKKLLWSEYCEDCRMAGEEQPCTYPENPVKRLKWIGLEIRLISLTLISAKLQMHGSEPMCVTTLCIYKGLYYILYIYFL